MRHKNGIFSTSTKRPLWMRITKAALLVLLPVVLFQCVWRVIYYRPFDIQFQKGHSYVVDFSPDGNTIASCSLNGPVQLWSYKSRQLISTLPRSVDGSRVLKFMQDGHLLAASGYKSLTLWNLKTNRIEATLSSSIGEIWAIDFSPDGTRMVVGGTANTAEIWDLRLMKMMHKLPSRSWIYSVAFSPDGDSVATGGLPVKVWSAQTGRLKWVPDKAESKVSGVVAFSPDGKFLATGYPKASLWDVQTRQLLHTLPQRWGVTSLAFSSDSRLLAVGSDDRDDTLWFWNTKDGTLLRTLEWYGSVRPMTFWHNDRNLATAHGGQIQLWRVN